MHVFFLIAFHIILLYQNGLTKEIADFPSGQEHPYENDVYKGLIGSDHDLEKRSISDVWNSIKNAAKNAWSTIKDFGKKTAQKVKEWVQNVKSHADRMKELFKGRLEDLRVKIKNAIKNIFGAGQVVKKCLQEENEAVDAALLGVVKEVTTCITDKIKGLSALENYDQDATLNDTRFMEQIESKLNACIESDRQAEECLQNVRKDILDETEKMEDKALKTRLETRGIADDLLDAITTCSTDGLIEASAIVATITMNVIQCITGGNNTK